AARALRRRRRGGGGRAVPRRRLVRLARLVQPAPMTNEKGGTHERDQVQPSEPLVRSPRGARRRGGLGNRGDGGGWLRIEQRTRARCGSSPRSAATKIGAGLHGRSGMHATVYARGIPQMSAFAFDARGRLWVTRSGSSQHRSDGVYLVSGPGATPVKVVSSIRGPL